MTLAQSSKRLPQNRTQLYESIIELFSRSAYTTIER